MKAPILFVLLSAALLTSMDAASKPKAGAEKSAPGKASPSRKNQRQALFDFQGEDVADALRKLAEQAGIQVVIEAGIGGPITLLVENQTPREVIDVIANMEGLGVDEVNGVFYIKKPRNSPTQKAGTFPKAEVVNELGGAFLEQLVPAMTKLFDAVLDYEGRPETAQKIAKVKKALLEALMAEGFSREEAFQLLLAEPGLSFFGMKR